MFPRYWCVDARSGRRSKLKANHPIHSHEENLRDIFCSIIRKAQARDKICLPVDLSLNLISLPTSAEAGCPLSFARQLIIRECFQASHSLSQVSKWTETENKTNVKHIC
eukprot:g83287.t1